MKSRDEILQEADFCPCCGHEKMAIDTRDSDVTLGEVHRLRCKNCGLSTQWNPSLEQILILWNRRTYSKEVRESLETMDALIEKIMKGVL